METLNEFLKNAYGDYYEDFIKANDLHEKFTDRSDLYFAMLKRYFLYLNKYENGECGKDRINNIEHCLDRIYLSMLNLRESYIKESKSLK